MLLRVCPVFFFLQVYGGEIMPSVPYKTILASVEDKTTSVIRQALDKYGMEDVDSHHYTLVMNVQPKDSNNPALRQERKLADEESPLKLVHDIPDTDVQVTFHLQPKNGRNLSVGSSSSSQAPWFLKKGDLAVARRIRTEPSSPNMSDNRRQASSVQGLNLEGGDRVEERGVVQRTQSMGLLQQTAVSEPKEQVAERRLASAQSESHLGNSRGLPNGLPTQVG